MKMLLTKDKLQIIKAIGHMEAAKICFSTIFPTLELENGLYEGLRYLHSATTLLGKVVTEREK